MGLASFIFRVKSPIATLVLTILGIFVVSAHDVVAAATDAGFGPDFRATTGTCI